LGIGDALVFVNKRARLLLFALENARPFPEFERGRRRDDDRL